MSNVLDSMIINDYELTNDVLAAHGVSRDAAIGSGMPPLSEVQDRLSGFANLVESRAEQGITAGDRLLLTPDGLDYSGKTIEDSEFRIGNQAAWTVAIAFRDTDLMGNTTDDFDGTGMRYLGATFDDQLLRLASENEVLAPAIGPDASLRPMRPEQYIMLSQLSEQPLRGATRLESPHHQPTRGSLVPAGLFADNGHHISVADTDQGPKKGIQAVLEPHDQVRLASVTALPVPEYAGSMSFDIEQPRVLANIA